MKFSVPSRRRINGRWYKLYDSYPTKSKANAGWDEAISLFNDAEVKKVGSKYAVYVA